MGNRTGCVPHHLAFKPAHLSGTALQLRLAWAWLPEDTSYARSPTPPSLTLIYHPVMGGHLTGAGAERGQVTQSQLHLQDIQEATGPGRVWAAQQSQCRLWGQSSPVLGLEVSLGLGCRSLDSVWAFHPPLAVQGHRDPKLQRVGEPGVQKSPKPDPQP